MANSTLLLADDSVTIQKVVNLTFSGEDIEVIAVGDGNSAMDMLRESRPDIVMADVNIPGVNGYEICEKVKAMGDGAPIPVVLLVGSFEPFDSEEAARVGADAHLTKPFESIAALVDTVHGLIGGGDPAETPRFDDTVEYPTGADIVIGPSDIPFAGGFEDETIQAEQMGRSEEPADESAEPAPEQEFETFEPEPESEEWSSAQDAGGTYTDLSEESSASGFESQTETPEAEGAPISEFAETQALDEYPVEVEYRDETYVESEVYAESGDAGQESHSDEFAAGTFEPEGQGEEPLPTEPYPEQDMGKVTVQLDEADLLELPVDRSIPAVAGEEEPLLAEEPAQASSWEEPVQYEDVEGTEEQFQEAPVYEEEAPVAADAGEEHFEPREERFEATIREVAFEHTSSESVSGAEISEEMIEAIAHRVIERLSDKAVREIAWEVVPDMAEIIIRRMIEERMKD